MPAPRLAPVFGALLVSAALAACDFAGADGVSGRWSGVAQFQTDTLLAEYNTRVTADYEAEFVFHLTDDEGLITGQVEAHMTGYRVVHEAGQAADTLLLGEEPTHLHELFGTFIDPTLEVDVPGGPYAEGLWTFDVAGRRAELDQFITHTHTIPLADGSTFTLDLRSVETFEMERVAE